MDVYIAFSIGAHSIYLTSLTNLENLANQQRKILFDINYGRIIDYVFDGTELVILFDRKILLKIDVLFMLSTDKTELFAESDQLIQQINHVLQRTEILFRKRKIDDNQHESTNNKKKLNE